MSENVELLLDARACLGEGVNWDAANELLYWVDIVRKEVHLFDPAKGEDRCMDVGQYVGAVVPTEKGDLLAAVHHGIARLDPDTGRLDPLADPEADLPDNRFNDGKCDPAGRFWAGTMHVDGKGNSGALYRIDQDLSIHRMVDQVGISNGLAWSADCKTMYYIDTSKQTVDAFDYDIDTGAVTNRRTVIPFPSELGHPDGMTIDEEGMLWVACWAGARVTRWDPQRGRLLQEIRLPVTNVTDCVFGGPEGDTLYISTARMTLSDEDLKQQPLAGGLFQVRPGVRGPLARPFGG